MRRPPKYGATVEAYVLIGNDEWTVRGQFDPASDGVNVEEIAGPGGRVLDLGDLSRRDQDRVEQAVIDCYAADEPDDSADCRADYERDSAIDRELEDAR